ncbi:hypothetical protein OIU76_000423, partial [Salix suchowensis]
MRLLKRHHAKRLVWRRPGYSSQRMSQLP